MLKDLRRAHPVACALHLAIRFQYFPAQNGPGAIFGALMADLRGPWVRGCGRFRASEASFLSGLRI